MTDKILIDPFNVHHPLFFLCMFNHPHLGSDDMSDDGGSPSVKPPAAPLSLSEEDIRLCTINRADETDIFGFELNFHRRAGFHSLSIASGRDDKPSSKDEREKFDMICY